MFEGVSVLFYYYFLEFFCISSSREETIPWVFFIPHSLSYVEGMLFSNLILIGPSISLYFDISDI